MVNIKYKISYMVQPGRDVKFTVQDMDSYEYLERFECSKDDVDKQLERLQQEYKNSQVCKHMM